MPEETPRSALEEQTHEATRVPTGGLVATAPTKGADEEVIVKT